MTPYLWIKKLRSMDDAQYIDGITGYSIDNAIFFMDDMSIACPKIDILRDICKTFW